MGLTAFSVSLWLSTTASSEQLPALVGDKAWDAGAIVDATSHHDFGLTRDSGVDQGWTIALSPDGAWVWNAGDGVSRVDYRPPAPAGTVADGQWHLLAFTVDPTAAAATLYLDGVTVAIYSLAGIGEVRSGSLPVVASRIGNAQIQIQQLRVEEGVITADELRQRWYDRTGHVVIERMSVEPVSRLRVMAWNIWHGGRRDGNQEGLAATMAAIQAVRADIVLMQETYGSGAHIAAGLGFHYYLRSSNLSIMSRFPIRETHNLYEPFRFGGVTVELSPGQYVALFSLWIHYLPDYGARMKDMSTPVIASELIAEERQTRGREIEEILALLKPHLATSHETPVIVAGDFNSPSHLDWSHETRKKHRDLVVDWPVSRSMADAGFIDAFRVLHPDPTTAPGYTWSPRFTEAWKDRIDFVYLHGPRLVPSAATVADEQVPRWPSDHAAVVVDVQVQPEASGR